ncbi:proteophosphoglycan related protein [Cyclospora cayetanensis]|uniref:Proteophosphoglycan related protein n=1 Tax=Cyclospora cayetanensis TaxID=88456 RepID=A0A1D3D7N8_9EIME|nr:proteophosphoglycan related protein [Cyclospora cayetanensis]
MDTLLDPRTKHLYISPCSPFRRFVVKTPTRQELYDAVAGGNLEALRNYRAHINTPICTYRQPGYGELFTTPQLCLLLQQDRLLNYLLADPFTDVEARSYPSGWTLLMIACAAEASLGIISLIIQRMRSEDHINVLCAYGTAALNLTKPESSAYLMLRARGALRASEILGTGEANQGDSELKDKDTQKETQDPFRAFKNDIEARKHTGKARLQELDADRRIQQEQKLEEEGANQRTQMWGATQRDVEQEKGKQKEEPPPVGKSYKRTSEGPWRRRQSSRIPLAVSRRRMQNVARRKSQ